MKKTAKITDNTGEQTQQQVQALEASLIQRAHELADEHFQHARAEYDHFVQQENERLQLIEEKETIKAKSQSNRKYRRLVQTSELNIQKNLEQLRWTLVEKVSQDARDKLALLSQRKTKQDQDKYLEIIINYVNHANDVLTERKQLSKTIFLSFNKVDLAWFQKNWDGIEEADIQSRFKGNTKIELLPEHHYFSGGVIVYTEDQKVRIDMTFEGRFEQLSEKIYQQVSTLFFAEISHESEKIHAG